MLGKAYLIFPLTAAVLYALAALALKAAERRGAGVGQITVLANLALAAAFAGFYPWGAGPPARLAAWWPIAAIGVTLVVGQVAGTLAFARGEVSVATPVLGTKVVLVALLASLFTARPVPAQTWVAAVVVLVGLWVLVGRPARADARRAAAAVGFGLACALAFAGFDLLTQVWSPRLGFGVLMPLGVAAGTVLSLPLLRWLRPPGRLALHVPTAAAKPLALGVALITLQSLLLIWSIGRYHDAPGANVVYASRGVWGVLLVQLLAGHLAHVEQLGGGAVFARRLIGAGVMMLGVVLAFLG